MNYLNKICFLVAETTAVHGDLSKSIKNYEEAMALSRKHNFHKEEAMTCDRVGMFHLSLNSSSSSSKHLCNTYRCYDDWNAKTKMHQLTKKHSTIVAQLNKIFEQ